MPIECCLILFMKTANLAHYSSYTKSFLLPTVNLMLNYILKPVQHKLFHSKYTRKHFLKVSVPNIIHTWLTWCTGMHLGARMGTRAMGGEYTSVQVLEGWSSKAESSLSCWSSMLGHTSWWCWGQLIAISCHSPWLSHIHNNLEHYFIAYPWTPTFDASTCILLSDTFICLLCNLESYWFINAFLIHYLLYLRIWLWSAILICLNCC